MKNRDARPHTPAYVIFYLLFSDDTWRIAMGVVLAILLTPHLAPPDFSTAGRAMLHIMLACIGWAVTAAPARWITAGLKKAILGKKQP